MIQSRPTESGTSTREDEMQRTVELLFVTVRQMHRCAPPDEPFLSPGQARLVFAMARNATDGISATELARIAGITPGAITQYADALIAKGIVSREEDPGDRRIVRLRLTAAARDQMRGFRHAFLASAAGYFDSLSIEELRQLNALLAKVNCMARDTGKPAP